MIDSATSVLLRRLRIALILCFAPTLLFALADLRLDRRQLVVLWTLKLIGLGVLTWGFAVLRPPKSRRFVVTIGLLTVTAMYVLSSICAVVGREPYTTPLLSIMVAVGAATLLPWGVLPQVALVGIASLATVVTVEQVTGSFWSLVSYPNVGVAIGLCMSVYVAYELERTREKLARYGLDRQRAEERLRDLNAELEARVAQRTAQLAAVNQKLESEVALHRQAKAEVTALVENANDAIWSVDRSYRVIAFNSLMENRYANLFGQPLSIGAKIDERVPPQWQRTWQELYDRAFAGERFTIEQETEMDGGRRFFATSFNPIVSDGAVTGATVFSADVTERKRAEEGERRHQAELAHVLRLGTVGEMAAGLAHEVNQPLAAMVNFARGCARRIQGGMNDRAEVTRVLNLIAGEALRAGEIIRRVRRLVRKESTRRDRVGLQAVLEDVLELLQPDVRQLGITVELRLEESAPAVVGDPIQIEQVVLNLVRNAIEAMAESASPRRLVVAIASSAGNVELTVEDTGPGLSGALADRAFDAFFTTKVSGLGMGLSISRTIAEAHDGKLVAAACASGACLRLILPAAPRLGSHPAVQAEQKPPALEALLPHDAPRPAREIERALLP
jgi:PAS domain S-box-containing protein